MTSVPLSHFNAQIEALAVLLQEPLHLRHHPSGHWRVDPTGEPALSPNAGLWQARGRGGWYNTAQEALIHLAHAVGSHSEPHQSDASIEHQILAIVSATPGRYSARQIRALANRHTGPIACASARCDAAVQRLIEQGRLVRQGADGRCAGRLYPSLQLAP